MNIQQFQYVLAVVDSKNFELAADKCCITQSTLSTMIGRLEDEIGIKIFNRKTKPVTVTNEGRRIIDRLRIIINEVEQLENLVQELKGEMVGELRIGIIPTVAPYLLPRFLPSFAQKFPRVKTVVKEMTTAEIQSALKSRSLDVGVLALPLEDSELEEYELYTEPFLLYDCREQSKAPKIATEELDYSKLWLLQEGHCLRTQVAQICERSSHAANHDLNFEFESGSMDSLLRFTKANKGLTIIPFLASLDLPETDQRSIIEFKTPVPVRSIGLITHQYFVKKGLLDELKNCINQEIKMLLPKQIASETIKPI